MTIDYICENCRMIAPKEWNSMICPFCEGYLRGRGVNIIGTRDSFGVGREFYDNKTGKYIDNFKTWEKAGFKEPGDLGAKNSSIIKDKVKEYKKTKNYPTKSKAINFAESI